MPDDFEDSASGDLPTEVNPDAIKLGDIQIFGDIPAKTTIIHDTIGELEKSMMIYLKYYRKHLGEFQ